jgi:tRNA A-37 threonylcarbamoyl transferase component Bud32
MVLRRRWTLEQVIGLGGTAAVYAATHRNGARVAIKVLHASLYADRVIRERFLREGYLVNSIGVSDVVKVIDDDVEGELAYLVMELLEGDSVEALRQRAGGQLAAADVVEIGCRLLTVLEAAHARGVLHRDIKPANLFRTTDPLGFKVLDFGIARTIGAEPAPEDTVGQAFVGTPVFMAPEQAAGQRNQLDGRTDLWGVGATLFTMLTGQYVHPGRTTTEILRAARGNAPPALREHLRSHPSGVALLVEQALQFEQHARFQSASEMRLACEGCRRVLAASGERSNLFNSALPRSPGLAPDAPGSSAWPAWRPVVRAPVPEPRGGFWSGRVGRLWWFYYAGPCTEETWNQYLAMVARMLETGLDATLACFAHRAAAPNPVQRKQMADFIDEHRVALARVDRFGLVIDSVVHRGAITAINWLVRKPFEERVFNSPVAAIRWLTENRPELAPNAIRTSIVSQVPRRSLWTALENEAPETIRTAFH